MTILYHLFDFRYIYLGKTTRSRGRFKIGIARDVKQRWKDIDRQIRGSKERPIFRARCLFAGRIERKLHRKYDRYKVKEKGWGREWFRLPLLSRWRVIFTIIFYSILSTLLILIAVIFGAAQILNQWAY